MNLAQPPPAEQATPEILHLKRNLPAGTLDAYACIASDSKGKPRLQILAAVHGNRNYSALARLRIDMVATIDSPE